MNHKRRWIAAVQAEIMNHDRRRNPQGPIDRPPDPDDLPLCDLDEDLGGGDDCSLCPVRRAMGLACHDSDLCLMRLELIRILLEEDNPVLKDGAV